MEVEDKALAWIEREIKNTKEHRKDKRNTEKILNFYDGYEAALKEVKKEILKFKKEEEVC